MTDYGTGTYSKVLKYFEVHVTAQNGVVFYSYPVHAESREQALNLVKRYHNRHNNGEFRAKSAKVVTERKLVARVLPDSHFYSKQF